MAASSQLDRFKWKTTIIASITSPGPRPRPPDRVQMTSESVPGYPPNRRATLPTQLQMISESVPMVPAASRKDSPQPRAETPAPDHDARSHESTNNKLQNIVHDRL